MATIEEMYERDITCARTGSSSPTDTNRGRGKSYAEPTIGSSTIHWSNTNRDIASRKAGEFSNENPYLRNLQLADNENDQSALYELAVKWEADKYTADYNSPLADLQRKKLAGINAEITGEVSNGEFSNTAQNSTPFDNPIANKQIELQKESQEVQKIVGFVSSAVTLASGVIGGISQLALLPSQVKVANANAAIAEETKDVQVAQAIAQKQSLENSNIASSISNLGQVAQMFTPETTDEEISDVLTSFGYSPQMIQPTIGAVRHYQKNPHLQAFFAEGEKQKRDIEAYNSVYLPQVVSRMYGVQQQIEDNKLDLEMYTTNIKASVASFFNNDDTINKIFNIESNKLDVSLANTNYDKNVLDYKNRDLSFKKIKLERDIYAWTKQLERNRFAIAQIESLEKSIYEKGDTPDTRAISDALKMKRYQLMTLSSQNFGQVVSIFNDATRNWYRSQALLNSEGYFNFADKYFETTANTIDMTFNDTIMNSELNPGDVTNLFMKAIDFIF